MEEEGRGGTSNSSGSIENSNQIESHFKLFEESSEMLCVICLQNKTPMICRSCAMAIEAKKAEYERLRQSNGSSPPLHASGRRKTIGKK